MAGRRVAVNGADAERIVSRLELRLAELELDPMEIVKMDQAQLLQAFLAGEIQAFAVMDRVPAPLVQAALEGRPSTLLPVRREFLVPGLTPGISEMHIPSYIYDSLTAPEEDAQEPKQGPQGPESLAVSSAIPTLTEELLLITSKEVPGDLIQDLASSLWSTLSSQGFTGEQVTNAWMQSNLELPPHSGLQGTLSPDLSTSEPPQPREYITIAAGNPRNISYRVAAGLLRSFKILCSKEPYRESTCGSDAEPAVVTTNGDVDSLQSLLAGHVDFSVVRGDAVWQAFTGRGQWETPQTSLCAVCALFLDYLTVLIASPQHLAKGKLNHLSGDLREGVAISGAKPIESLNDLEGRRVSMRLDPGHTERSNALMFFSLSRFLKTEWQASIISREPSPKTAFHMFERGEIDGLFLTTAHPSVKIRSVLRRCEGSKILGITGLERDVGEMPFVYRAAIDLAAYGEQDDSQKQVPTVGIPRVLVTRTDTPDEIVSSVLDTFTKSLKYLKRDFPVLQSTSEAFLGSATFIPYHQAAQLSR